MTTGSRMSNKQFQKFMDMVHVMHDQAFELGQKVVEESTSKTLEKNLADAVVKVNKAFQHTVKQDGFYLEAVLMFALGYASAMYDVEVDFSVDLDTMQKADVKVGDHAYQLKLGKSVFDQGYLKTLAHNQVELLVVRTYNQSKSVSLTVDEAFVKMVKGAGLTDEDVEDMSDLVKKLHAVWMCL